MRERLFLSLSLTFVPSFSYYFSFSLSPPPPSPSLWPFRAHLLTISPCCALLTQRDRFARVPFPFVSHLRGLTRRRRRRRIAWAIAYVHGAPRQREHGAPPPHSTSPRLSSRILSCATSPLSARCLIAPFSFFPLSLSVLASIARHRVLFSPTTESRARSASTFDGDRSRTALQRETVF